jgi:hypothetical protein
MVRRETVMVATGTVSRVAACRSAGLPPASNPRPPELAHGPRPTSLAPFARAIDELMSWRVFRAMTDSEIHALWLYLRGVPPKAFGGKSSTNPPSWGSR